MTIEKWGVAKVGGAEPERFFIFCVDTGVPSGQFMDSSDFLFEEELRTELALRGRSEASTNSLVERARANPV